MKRFAVLAGAVLAAYQTGAVLGYKIGAANAKAVCDWEWARMLENDMVGPGSTTRPGAASDLGTLRLSRGV